MLTFGSLFAGVGGFDLGFEQAGWTSRWQVEWDKHCQQVLARHWPTVERFDDVRNIAGHIPLAGRPNNGDHVDGPVAHVDGEQNTRRVLEPVDVISFGSPCQDLSVAGRRAGLNGARSGLFYEAIRIIEEMRDATAGVRPRFAIWENVPGAFSSNKGDDFRAVIGAFADLGAVDVAWRVLDSRFFGVAQRRRRVFVVADFGGECAGSLLFEPAGLCWDSAAGGTSWEEAAGGFACGLGADSRVAGTLGSHKGGGQRDDLDTAGAYVVQAVADVVGYLSPGAHPGGLNGQDAYTGQLVVQQPLLPEVVGPLTATGMSRARGTESIESHHVLAVQQPFVKGRRAQTVDDDETWQTGQIAPTLNQFNVGDVRTTVTVVAPTLTAANDPSRSPQSTEVTAQVEAVINASTQVRRLTPRECERLQGFPDDHTRWRADGKEQSDSQRYRQMGNAVTVPVARWIAEQINAALQEET